MQYFPRLAISLILTTATIPQASSQPIRHLKNNFSPHLAQSGKCEKWTHLNERPLARLPAGFQNGCVFYNKQGQGQGNNNYQWVYVLKDGFPLPTSGAQNQANHGASPELVQQLSRLTVRGNALKITWYSANTLGAQKTVGAIPYHLAFADVSNANEGGLLCMRVSPGVKLSVRASVVCIGSGGLPLDVLVQTLSSQL